MGCSVCHCCYRCCCHCCCPGCVKDWSAEFRPLQMADTSTHQPHYECSRRIKQGAPRGNVRPSSQYHCEPRTPPSRVKDPDQSPPPVLPLCLLPPPLPPPNTSPALNMTTITRLNPTKTYLAHRRGARVAALPRRPLRRRDAHSADSVCLR